VSKISGVDYVLGTKERFTTDWWNGKTVKPVIITGVPDQDCKVVLQPGNTGRSRRLLKIQDKIDQPVVDLSENNQINKSEL